MAPVRETAAQVLGAIATALSTDSLLELAHLLRQLSDCKEWAVRQSGLLGLKYLLAARPDCQVLDAVMPALTRSLSVLSSVPCSLLNRVHNNRTASYNMRSQL